MGELRLDGDPSTDDSASPGSIFKRLQVVYLIGSFLMAAANHLPGAYRYAIYQSYGMSRSTIELFYIGYYGSSLLIGTIIGSLADKIGRRLACVLFGVFYILYCLTSHFPSLSILALGTVPWGVASTLDQTAFEAWLVTEHRALSLDTSSLKRILRDTSLVKIFASIGVAFVSQFLVSSFGYVAPFDVAIGCSLVMIVFILCTWPENYGNKQTSSMVSFATAFHVLRKDVRIILLGLSTSFFETTSYIYGIEWTPALQAARGMVIYDPIPLGFCFAVQLVSRFLGTIAYGLIAHRFRAESFMIIIFFFAIVGLSVPIFVPNAQWLIMIGFCLFEFCFGVYRPASSFLRSEYIADEIRATMMNYLRVPQLLLVLAILLSHFQMSVMFIVWIVMSVSAMLCMIILRCLPPPNEKAIHENQQVLLSIPLSIQLGSVATQPEPLELVKTMNPAAVQL